MNYLIYLFHKLRLHNVKKFTTYGTGIYKYDYCSEIYCYTCERWL